MTSLSTQICDMLYMQKLILELQKTYQIIDWVKIFFILYGIAKMPMV